MAKTVSLSSPKTPPRIVELNGQKINYRKTYRIITKSKFGFLQKLKILFGVPVIVETVIFSKYDNPGIQGTQSATVVKNINLKNVSK